MQVPNVAYSDHRLLHFLKSLSDGGYSIKLPYRQIAEYSGISEQTVWRAMNRLENAGLISRVRQPGDRWYTYRVINDECA